MDHVQKNGRGRRISCVVFPVPNTIVCFVLCLARVSEFHVHEFLLIQYSNDGCFGMVVGLLVGIGAHGAGSSDF